MFTVVWVQFAVFVQLKGVLKSEGSAAQCTPVTSLPVVKTTRFQLPHKPEVDSSVHTVSILWGSYIEDCYSQYYHIFTHLKSQIKVPSIDPFHIFVKFMHFLHQSFSLYNHTDISINDLHLAMLTNANAGEEREGSSEIFSTIHATSFLDGSIVSFCEYIL